MLVKRVASAAVGIIYLILMLYIKGWFFGVSILLFSIVGMREFYTALKHKGFMPIEWMGYLFISVIFYAVYMNMEIQLSLVVLFTVLVLLIGLSSPIFSKSTTPIDVLLSIGGIIYPGLFFLFLIYLMEYAPPYNTYLLILAFFITWATDTFAYFVGRRFGSRKLCPRISPKKTIEGSLGGLGGSIVTSLLIGWILNNFYYLDMHYLHYVFFGIIAGTFSQAGDLAASVLKRYCGVKDFGNILPGHGGLLDRFDSLLFTAPVIYLYYLMFLTP